MAEFSPTQKLDQLGIVVRKKMAKQRDIGASDLISMAETAEASLLPSEMEMFQEEEFFDEGCSPLRPLSCVQIN